ncbi:MAG TPA: serine/threonine-protein kinase [Kofleriaceae bacterium]|jgi:serine/threonine-protein kinase|nr:serine/threonine-protein kinase [Kofleriaceae bacterium]
MLDDKYRIEHLLATGGMGAVYLGTHVGLRKRVAIKILNPLMNSAAMVERFHREAVTASQIGHEGIAQVTDIGTSGEGEPFLVMEYLEGESLAARLKREARLAIEDACELGCAILSPLEAAHRAGIVHRDLKPDNVFLVRQSRGEMIKLLDFGISRAAGQESSFRLTTTGLVLGTPYYMSPEQARGESVVTPAADLYAFGVMLYEMLIGEVPIRAENYNALMYRVSIGDYVPPRVMRAELPETLEHIIMWAMARTASERPSSAAELEHALWPFCRPVFRDHAIGRLSGPLLPPKLPPLESLRPTADTGPNPPADSGHARTMLDGSGAVTGDRQRPSASGDAAVPGAQSPAGSRASGIGNPADGAGQTPAPRRSRAAIAIGVGVAVIAGVVGVGLFALNSPDPPPSTAAAPPLPSRAALPTTAPAQAAPAQTVQPPGPAPEHDPAGGPDTSTITVKLTVDPAGAAIMLDGTAVVASELVVPRDGALHQLRITAAGYLGHEEAIRFDESQRVVVALRRAAVPVRGKQPHKDRVNGIDSESPYH